MTDSADPRLERTAEAVADAEALDWEREAAERPGQRRRIAGLRALARLAAAHREARATAGGRSAAERASESAAAEPPVFTWGLLRALSRIGEGAFGEVWRAFDPSLQREVALKLRRIDPLPPGQPALATTSDPATRRTLDEARRLARVRHPHVLTVFGAAEHDGRAGIWTELIRGETLEDRLGREGPVPPRDAAAIGADLCGALGAVHAAGLVHGDVKAANVMLERLDAGDGRPRVVLMDFSAAKDRRLAEHLPRGGPVSGTPLVLAPEVLAGGPPSVRSDVYAVGALLHRLATGRYPVEAATLEELRERHARGGAPAAAPPRPGFSRALARIARRALAPRPEDRFASAGEMRRALLALGARRRRWLTAAAVAAVLAAATATSLAWWQSRRPSAERYPGLSALPGVPVGGPLVPADTLTGEAGAGLGWAAAPCGDVNGDGCADFLVASTSYTGTLYEQGRVQLFLGSPTGRFGPPAETWLGDQPQTSLALSMAVVGDTGGGRTDLLISDGWVDPATHRQVGSVSLYRGRPGGFEQSASLRIFGTQDGARFGHRIAAVGDVNGDGYPDVLVSADHYTDRFPDEGAVFLYLGGPHGLSSIPAWAAYGGCRDGELGYRLVRVGDINHDGYDDILLGEPGWSRTRGNQGRVEIFYGGPGGPRLKPDWVLEGDQEGGLLGEVVVAAGDVNGDGCADFLVTQPGWSGRGVNEGRVMLFLGSPRGPSRSPAWVERGYGAYAHLGSGAAVPGDMDGDGVPDIVTGAWGYCNGRPERPVGVCTVHLSGSGPGGYRGVSRLVGGDPGTPIGEEIVPVGDVDGDGLADFLVTQPRYPNWFSVANGRVFLILGRRVRFPG